MAFEGRTGRRPTGVRVVDQVPPRALPRVRRKRDPGQKRKGAQTSEKNRKYDLTTLENIRLKPAPSGDGQKAIDRNPIMQPPNRRPAT